MIWIALLMSVVIYGVVAFAVVPAGDGSIVARILGDPILIALHVIGFMMVTMSAVMFATLSRRAGPKQTAFIIRWAMTESAAVLGLIAAFFGNDARLFFPLGVLAVAGMLIAFPTREHFLTT